MNAAMLIIGAVAWFLIGAWNAFTGPQNVSGWVFFVTMPLWAAGIAWLAARLLDARHRP